MSALIAEFKARSTRIRNRLGIMILAMTSIPLVIPRATINTADARKILWKNSTLKGDASRSLNARSESAASKCEKEFVAALTM